MSVGYLAKLYYHASQLWPLFSWVISVTETIVIILHLNMQWHQTGGIVVMLYVNFWINTWFEVQFIYLLLHWSLQERAW